jgi:hypothetical protein
MTYQDAQEMITIHGEYYSDLGRPFKRKIIPKKSDDVYKYMSDLFSKHNSISNEDAKRYSSNNEFAVMSFDITYLNED